MTTPQTVKITQPQKRQGKNTMCPQLFSQNMLKHLAQRPRYFAAAIAMHYRGEVAHQWGVAHHWGWHISGLEGVTSVGWGGLTKGLT